MSGNGAEGKQKPVSAIDDKAGSIASSATLARRQQGNDAERQSRKSLLPKTKPGKPAWQQPKSVNGAEKTARKP
ncbi:hypothetical protein HK105_204704 [Polyrhizophydium stewartii]|uniref:Uncharacterized protein n=1 Tax=Polyrhizophydium stewartii TaxID=2732419 RepID=A0ABR4N896_9FUNG